mgnify:CR=1
VSHEFATRCESCLYHHFADISNQFPAPRTRSTPLIYVTLCKIENHSNNFGIRVYVSTRGNEIRRTRRRD